MKRMDTMLACPFLTYIFTLFRAKELQERQRELAQASILAYGGVMPHPFTTKMSGAGPPKSTMRIHSLLPRI